MWGWIRVSGTSHRKAAAHHHLGSQLPAAGNAAGKLPCRDHRGGGDAQPLEHERFGHQCVGMSLAPAVVPDTPGDSCAGWNQLTRPRDPQRFSHGPSPLPCPVGKADGYRFPCWCGSLAAYALRWRTLRAKGGQQFESGLLAPARKALRCLQRQASGQVLSGRAVTAGPVSSFSLERRW